MTMMIVMMMMMFWLWWKNYESCSQIKQQHSIVYRKELWLSCTHANTHVVIHKRADNVLSIDLDNICKIDPNWRGSFVAPNSTWVRGALHEDAAVLFVQTQLFSSVAEPVPCHLHFSHLQMKDPDWTPQGQPESSPWFWSDQLTHATFPTRVRPGGKHRTWHRWVSVAGCCFIWAKGYWEARFYLPV